MPYLTKIITSKNNENIKYISKLLNSSKFRNQQREFIIEGLRICIEAVKSGVKIKKAFYTYEFYNKFDREIKVVLDNCKELYIVNKEITNKISDTESPQGIICICNAKDELYSIESVKENSTVVVLENIQNPSNLGAIIRTCDAFNIESVIVSKGSCDIYNPKVLRGSMGSIFRSRIVVSDDIHRTICELNSHEFLTVAMVAEDGAVNIKYLPGNRKIAIVIGNEGSGISQSTKLSCTSNVLIPINKNVDSLNAAVASGIAIWELTRKRTDNQYG